MTKRAAAPAPDWNAPIEGQAAAIVAASKRGPYLARFPFAVSGGRDEALAFAASWRDREAPGAHVYAFTGRVVHRRIWEAAQPTTTPQQH